MGGVVGGALSLGSALISGSSASDAAQIQADAANQANAQQLSIFNKQNAQLAPQRAIGYTALNQIGSLLPGQSTTYDANGNPIGTQTGTGYLTKQFTNEDLNSYLAPNYAFNLNQGKQSLNNQLNATGGLVSGNTEKALQDYTLNFAGNSYQNAFNNYLTQRGNIYNTLASIAGIGQSAQSQSNALATNYGTNSANLTTGAAAANAAGLVGQANAYSGGINNIANQFQLSNLLGGSSGGFGTGYGSLPNIGGIGGSITNYLSGGPSFNNSFFDTGLTV